MQQSSSLPERNLQIDGKPLLTTIEHLGYQLWLESSLNQLQIRLKDYLISLATTTSSAIATESGILEIVVNELHKALSDSLIAFAQCIVAVALS